MFQQKEMTVVSRNEKQNLMSQFVICLCQNLMICMVSSLFKHQSITENKKWKYNKTKHKTLNIVWIMMMNGYLDMHQCITCKCFPVFHISGAEFWYVVRPVK